MKPIANFAPLALAALLGACMTELPVDDDDYGDTVHVDEDEAFDEGKADSLTRTAVCEEGATLSVNACAFLGALAFAEGTHAHYNYTFAYRKFSSYADHPRIRVCAGSYCSTAAGRYQILSKTWNGIRSGLADFSPANQDQAALRLIRGRGVSNIDSIDTLPEFDTAIRKLNREWASLPGSPYGQPRHSMSKLWGEFKRLASMP